jgi:hypothetical protein
MFWHSHYKVFRECVTNLLEERPRTMIRTDYASELVVHPIEKHEGSGYVPRMFASCPACEGDGRVQNPAWRDDDDHQNEPEALDCEVCLAFGFVELVEPPEPAPLDDDMPF